MFVEGEDLQLNREIDLVTSTPSGTTSTHGAKLRMLVTPAATNLSATVCAACAGVVITPMAICSFATVSAKSSRWVTVSPLITSPTRWGATSTSAATRNPRLANPA